MGRKFDKKRIRALCDVAEISLEDLATQMGCNLSNLYIRLKKPIFNFEERAKIAQILGAKYEAYFVDKEDGTVFKGDTVHKIVKQALAYKDMSFQEFADKMGVAKQTLNVKLLRAKLSDEQIEDIARELNCTYENWYLFPNGVKF